MNKQFDVIDIIQILSLYLAIQNLQENETQSEILKQKLDNQDNTYLKNTIILLEKSIEQNKKIIAQNEELLKRR